MPPQYVAPAYQTPVPQHMQQAAPQTLAGKYVDSLETVKAADVMMDGTPMFFPSTDGRTVYRKQLQPDGTSRITSYTVAEDAPEEKKPDVAEVVEQKIKGLSDELLSGLEDISDRLDKVERQLKAKAGRGDEK